MSAGDVVTVVLPASEKGKVSTLGTKVLMPDGTRIPAVRNVEVLSHLNGGLMARLELFCRVEVRTPDEQGPFRKFAEG